jgi:cobalt-zinc-cadmium efflux system membrane fusion protein
MKNPKIPIISSLIMILVLSCGTSKKDEEETEESENALITSAEFTPVQYQNAGINLGHIEYKNLRDVVKASGYLVVPPQYRASVSPVTGGIVTEISVLKGIYVKKGQILAKLQHPDFILLQEEYVKALAEYGFLEKEYERQNTLRNSNVNAEKVFQQTESEYKIVRGHLHSLEAQLKMLSLDIQSIAEGNIVTDIPVLSPINGQVEQINASIGTFAQPDKSLFEIIDNSRISVELMVYEKDIYKVRSGQKVSFILTNQDNRQIKGEISGISKIFDSETKSLVVLSEIIRKTGDLIPGMFVNALIEIGADTLPVLPVDAIVHEAGKDYIFIKSDNKDQDNTNIVFHKIQVKTGINDLGYIEVNLMEEISPDAEIAIKGAFFIQSVFKPGEEEE